MSTAPPRKPGRPRDPELEGRRKSAILDIAAKVFSGHGFAAADVQVIADRVGVGKGTVYRYFPTKEALFLAAVERGLNELEAAVDAVMEEPDLDPIDRIERAIQAYLTFFHRRPEMAEVFIQERAASLKEGDEKECQRRLLVEHLIAEGRVRPMPVERFFAVIGDTLYGTILTNLLTSRAVDPDEQARDVLDVIFLGVLSDAERGRAKQREKQ
jgi:AcrR family transcriptional regulator